MNDELILSLNEKYGDYLKDESRFIGAAQNISFPNSVQELELLFGQMVSTQMAITIQGARTGIVGAAVPSGGGLVLNLSKVKSITGLHINSDGDFSVTVEPGVILSDLSEALEKKAFDTSQWSQESMEALVLLKKSPKQFFPPDPTETTATIGGMMVCNAHGITAYHYGGISDYIQQITVALTNGQTWRVNRGKYIFDETGCNLPNGTRLETGKMCEHPISRGLAPYPGMDLIELFAGSEGMLGVITSLKLRLLPEPAEKWGIMFFFGNLSSAIEFSKKIVDNSKKLSDVVTTAIELFDKNTLILISQMKAQITSIRSIPDIAPDKEAAVYVQLAADNVEKMEDALLSFLDIFAECGGSEEDNWAATGSKEIEKLLLFRHAVPEAINMQIDRIRQTTPEIHKMGADFSMPSEKLDQVIEMYQQGISKSGLNGFIFGHVGSCHLHVNLLPETMKEYEAAENLMADWAKSTVEMGGRIVEENGVGKVKRNLLMKYIPTDQLNVAKKIKTYFDPSGLLNPGNMF